MSLHRGALACLLLLAACKPGTNGTASQPASEGAQSGPVAVEMGTPLKAFESYCHLTGAKQDQVVSMARMGGLPPIQDKMMPAVAAIVGDGEGFVVVNEPKSGRVVLLGAPDTNACSIFAMGYDEQAIRRGVIAHYKLNLIHRGDTGLQIREMFIPNGAKGTQGDAVTHGLIGIITGKAPGQGITVSFIPPETARRVLSGKGK